MIGFPLLIIPFAIYNMIAFLTPGFDWASAPYTFPLKSGVQWGPTFADAFLVFSLLMLMFEVIKSTRHGRSIVEHFLVLLLVCGAAAEFVRSSLIRSSVRCAVRAASSVVGGAPGLGASAVALSACGSKAS